MNTQNGAADLLQDDFQDDSSQSPPLQLPKVGWDDDEDDDGRILPFPSMDPPEAPIPPASSKSKPSDNSTTSLRSVTRSELELQPIPEDMSMHGPWPDFCTYYDYDLDRKKAYRYRMFGRLTCRSTLLLLAAFAVFLVVVTRIGGSSSENTSNIGVGTNAKLTEEQAQLYEMVATSFHPLWYDRSRGWNGSAYLQSYEFCFGIDRRVPCPYEAYCPLGAGHAPSGGTRDGVQWSPVSDSANDWGEFTTN